MKDQMVLREKWAYFFKYAEETTEEDLQKLVGKDLIIKRAYEELDRFSWSEKELNNYESVEMKKAADEAVKEAAFEKGEAKGLAKGLEKGLKKGLEKGRQERDSEIAIALLKQLLPIQQIAEATGLSTEEIERLKK